MPRSTRSRCAGRRAIYFGSARCVRSCLFRCRSCASARGDTCPRDGRQLHPRRIGPVRRQPRQGCRARQALPPARARVDRQADGHPPEPRHALLVGGVRPRRGPGDDHAARRGQAVHVDAGRSTRTTTPVRLRTAGAHTFTREKIGTRYVVVAVRTLVDPADPKDVAAGPRAAGRDQGRAERPPATSRCRTGIRPARRRCATRCWCSARRCPITQAHVRHEGPGRSGAASDRYGRGLGRQSRQGRDLSQRHAAEERRQDRLQAHREGRAGRRLLVGQRLQRRKATSRRTR